MPADPLHPSAGQIAGRQLRRAIRVGGICPGRGLNLNFLALDKRTDLVVAAMKQRLTVRQGDRIMHGT